MINGKRDYDVPGSPPTSMPSATPAAAGDPVACPRFKSAVLKPPYLNQVLHHHGLNHHNEDQDDVQDEERVQEVTRRLKKTSLAFHERLDGEKHYHQKKKGMKEKKNQKDGYQYRYQYDQYGQQIQQQHGRQHRSASKKDLLNVIRGHGLATACDVSETSTTVPALQQYGKHKKGYKRVCVAV